MAFEVDFEPIGRRVMGDAGTTLLNAAQRAGVMLTAVCGGEGSCGRCIIRVMSGQVSPPNTTEELELGREDVEAGWRLACQTEIRGDVGILIPPDSLVTLQRTQTEGHSLDIELNPAVRTFDVELVPPTLNDLRSDATRLRDAIGIPTLTFDVQVLRDLPKNLRAHEFHSSVWVRDSTVIAVRPPHTVALGLAVDIGTTKLAAYLIDLASGETLASAGAINPQIAFGEDVMSRISYVIDHPDGGEQLRVAIVDALNGLAHDLCAHTARDIADIADAVIVGNTAMHHLFLGLPVKQLGLAPYVVAEDAAFDVLSRDLGLNLALGASVHFLPNIAGFVGADHVAMLLATGLSEYNGVALGMDIGTNTEISLVTRDKHLSCSVASGPAFEGAHIKYGMRAAPGAIENIVIRDQRLFIKTVEDMPPVGLCGSGILDLVAQMYRAGIINSRGAMLITSGNPRVRQSTHGPEFVVVTENEQSGTEVTFSRADVAEIQLAKGAMRAGINILLERTGLTQGDIDQVIIAGAFGTYLEVQSGIDIGMFPSIDRYRFKQVGNAAGAGARMALLSLAQRTLAKQIAQQVEYVELAAEPGFQRVFANALALG